MATIVIDGGEITILPPDQWALNVHDDDKCAGRTCIIHSPTLHKMRQWPLNWRADRQLFERICDHGVGHPDPDQRAFWREVADSDDSFPDPDTFVGRMLNHTCDGCCAEYEVDDHRGATAP